MSLNPPPGFKLINRPDQPALAAAQGGASPPAGFKIVRPTLTAPAAPTENYGAGQFAGDIVKQAAGGAVSAVGYGLRGVGETFREGGELVTSGINRVAGTDLRAVNPLTRPAAAVEGLGKSIKDTVSAPGKDRIAGSTPEGDVTKPSTWTLGPRPSLSGYALQAADVAGQVAPIVGTALLTRGQSLKAQLGQSAGTAAALGGGGLASEEGSRVREMDAEGLKQLPLYDSLVAGGMAPAQAQEEAALAAEKGAFRLAAPVGSVSGLLLGGVLSNAGQKALGRVFGQSMLARGAGGVALEAPAEGAQEVLESVAGRAGAAVLTGEERNLTENTFPEAVLGAIGGSGPAVLGAMVQRPKLYPNAKPGSTADAANTIARPAPPAAQPTPAAPGSMASAAEVLPAAAPMAEAVQPLTRPTQQPAAARNEKAYVPALRPPWMDEATGEIDVPDDQALSDMLRRQRATQQDVFKSQDLSAQQLAEYWGVPEARVAAAIEQLDKPPEPEAVKQALRTARIAGQPVESVLAAFPTLGKRDLFQLAKQVERDLAKELAPGTQPSLLEGAADGRRDRAPAAADGPSEQGGAIEQPSGQVVAGDAGGAADAGPDIRADQGAVAQPEAVAAPEAAAGEAAEAAGVATAAQPAVAEAARTESPAAPVQQPEQAAAATTAEPTVSEAEAPAASQQGTPVQEAAQPEVDETPEVLDSDITPPSGGPFSIRTAAESAAKREGNGARVVEVEGGFVVRKPIAGTDTAPSIPGATSTAPAETPLPSAPDAQASPRTDDSVSPALPADAASQQGSDQDRTTASAPSAQATPEGGAVQAAAAQAATSPENDRPQPTEAQKEAGNYKVGKVRLNGFDISIENPAGTKRRPEWPALKNHYGYIRGTVGRDKDHVDVFMTDRAEDASLPVFVVDQRNADGRFDEHKIVLGVATEKEARATYLANYSKGWTGLGAITQMTQEQFKAWVRDPAKTKMPASKERKMLQAEQRAAQQAAPPPTLPRVMHRPKAVEAIRSATGATLKDARALVTAIESGPLRVNFVHGKDVEAAIAARRATPSTPAAGTEAAPQQEQPREEERRQVAAEDAGQDATQADADARQDADEAQVATKAEAKKKAPASAEKIDDAGDQLRWNRKGVFRGGGLTWDQLKGENDALKMKLATKDKVWGRPNWEEMVAAVPEGADRDGFRLVAHMVKQAYDAIATKPAGRTDEAIQNYIEAVTAARAAAEDLLNSKAKQRAVARAIGQRASAMSRTSIALSAITDRSDRADLQPLFTALFPEQAAGTARFVRGTPANDRALALGKKALNAMQFSLDSAVAAMKAMDAGWPAKQESWQVRGIRVVPTTAAPTSSIYESKKGGPFYARLVFPDRIEQMLGRFDTREAATTAIDAALADFKPGAVLLVDKRRAILGTFESEQAATEAARALVRPKQEESAQDEEADDGPWVRTGVPRRQPGENITSDRLKEAFGFRGVNFGKWVRQEERQDFINAAHDALLDLAEALEIPAETLSFNGMLGIAFGAQGNGGKHAAHFVAGFNEINLTRTAGAGALAHEWAHAFDHYFGTIAGLAKDPLPWASTLADRGPSQGGIRQEIADSFRLITRTMRSRNETAEERSVRVEKTLEQNREWLTNTVNSLALREAAAGNEAVRTALAAIENGERGEYVEWPAPKGRRKSPGTVGANVKAIADALGWDYSKADTLHRAASGVHYALEQRRTNNVLKSIHTDYYSKSRALDGKKTARGGDAYWSTSHEMFARAFESFVMDRLAERDQRNDFLVRSNRRDQERSDPDFPYPAAAERKAFNDAFARLVADLQVRQDPDTGREVLFSLPEQPAKQEAFDTWFNGSQVTNPDGTPRVLYHGTADEFTIFKKSKAGANTEHATASFGFFFTPSKTQAKHYAEKASDNVPAYERIVDVYLSVRNPYRMTLEEAQAFETREEAAAFRAFAQARGFDGIQVGEDTWIAFDPGQIKSASGNRGTYDAANPDIRYSLPAAIRTGLTTQAVQHVVDRQTAAWKGGPTVRVLDSAEQLPAGAKRDPRYRTAEGFYDGRSVWLVAPNLSSTRRVSQVLAHEVIGHFGVDRVVGIDEWKQIETAIAALEASGRSSERMRKLIKDVRARYGDIDSKTFAKEVIAVMAERGVKNGILDRVIRSIRRFLRQQMPNLQWSEAELVQLLVRSERLLVNGETAAQVYARVGAVAFSQSARGELENQSEASRSSEDPAAAPASARSVDAGRDRAASAERSRAERLRAKGVPESSDPDVTGGLFSLPEAQEQAAKLAQVAAAAPDEFASALEAAIQQSKSGTVERVKDWLAHPLKNLARINGWMAAAPLLPLVDMAERHLPGASEYGRLAQLQDAMRSKLSGETGALVDEMTAWGSKNPEQRALLFKAVHKATLTGVDPSKDVYEPGTVRVGSELLPINKGSMRDLRAMLKEKIRGRSGDSKVDMIDRLKATRGAEAAEKKRQREYPSQRAEFEALDAEAQRFFVAMRDMYAQRRDLMEKLLIERIQASELPERETNAAVDRIREQFELHRLSGVYFPLQRYGRYWVAAERNGEDTFLKFESQREMKRAVAALKQRQFRIKAQGMQKDTTPADAPSGTFVADIVGKLQKAGAPEKLIDEIYQSYLAALPELSMRKHSIHRRNVAGFDSDAIRAFAHNSMHGAHQLARMKYMHRLQGVLTELDASLKSKRAAEDADSSEVVRMDALLQELTRRHEWIANPKDSKWAATANSIGFLFYLGLTPAAAIVNMTQNAITTMPYLGSRYGFDQASKVMSTAFLAAARTRGNIRKALSDPDEIAAYDLMEPAIDKTQAHHEAAVANQGSAELNETWLKVMKVVTGPFQLAEVINRETAGIAAYRLARKGGNGVPAMGHQAAVEFAINTINETHFIYANYARPRWAQEDWQKVLTQFKQFSVNMTAFMVKNVWDATRSADPETKRIARRTLAGTLGMTFVFSGAMGLPLGILPAVVNAAASAFGGDDDEPFDFWVEFRNYLAEQFGPDVANVIARGPVNALTGADFASRTSLSDLFFREPDRDLEGREEYLHYAGQLLGPVVGGLGMSFFNAKQLVDEGHYFRATEKLVPKAIRDVMKAARFATEGVNTVAGAPVLEDVSGYQQLLQAIGFTPAEISLRYDRNSAIKNFEIEIQQRRQRLMGAWGLSVRLGDPASTARALERIQAFNRGFPEWAVENKSLRASLRGQLRSIDRNDGGIVVNPRIAARATARARFGDDES